MKYSNDKKVIFNEDNHTYFLGDKRLTSVTQYISKFKPVFDSDKIAGKYAKKNGLIKSDVLKMWKDKGLESMKMGTFIHKIFEDFILNIPIQVKDEYIKCNTAIKVISELFQSGRLEPVETEYIVYNDEYAGQIDCIAKNNKGEYFILDWKTNSEIKYENRWQKMLGEHSDLDDCSYNHYSIQLKMYQSMIKEYKIKDSFIVHLLEDTYEIIKIN